MMKGDVETADMPSRRTVSSSCTACGHWLGLDVHDVGHYGTPNRSRTLEPGMVLTVEPGLYIAPDADVPEAYRGMGIRIEDDILITANGIEILTGERSERR
jgi:Xaa-Pro aminopeptidase